MCLPCPPERSQQPQVRQPPQRLLLPPLVSHPVVSIITRARGTYPQINDSNHQRTCWLTETSASASRRNDSRNHLRPRHRRQPHCCPQTSRSKAQKKNPHVPEEACLLPAATFPCRLAATKTKTKPKAVINHPAIAPPYGAIIMTTCFERTYPTEPASNLPLSHRYIPVPYRRPSREASSA